LHRAESDDRLEVSRDGDGDQLIRRQPEVEFVAIDVEQRAMAPP
jgi:hypothetical protein